MAVHNPAHGAGTALKRLNTEHHGALRHAVQSLYLLQCSLEGSKRTGMQEKHHVDELRIRLIGINRRMRSADANPRLRQQRSDIGHYTGTICHRKAHVVSSFGLVNGLEGSRLPVGQKPTMTRSPALAQ